MDRKVIISCEHAGNKVPPEYRHLFDADPAVLNTHRGLDIGALELTQTLGKTLDTDIYVHKISRLIVDLNRSLHNPSAFSEFMEGVDRNARKQLVRDYYLPHRKQVGQLVEKSVRNREPVFHLSVHTFTPKLGGVVRNADIGFLYDPRRDLEKKFCWHWRKKLQEKMPELKYRMNYPYRGTMDGFTTYLRKEFSMEEYLGIELEVNQKFPQSGNRKRWKLMQQHIANTLESVLQETGSRS